MAVRIGIAFVCVTREGKKLREKAKRIVKVILADMTDRRGLRQEWEQIDEDIQKEIIENWTKLVEDELKK